MPLILCLALYGLLLFYTVKIAREEDFSVLLSILGTLLLGPLMLLIILLWGRRKQRRRNTRRRGRRNSRGDFSMPSRTPGDVEDWIEECQKSISALLYISLLAHGIEVFLNDVGVLTGLVPALQVISAVAALLFFLGECVLLPPVGVLIMTALAAVLFFVIPYFVGFLAGLFVGSFLLMVVGGIIAVLSTSLIIFVSNGIIVGAVIAPIIVAPFALGFGATAATAVAGTGVAAAVHAGVQKITPGELFHPRRVLANLLMLFVLIWPTLTWFGVCPGMFALKPVQRAQQQYLSFSKKHTSATYKAFFTGEGTYRLKGYKYWTFEDGFYDTYIYPGRNTFAQGATPASSCGNKIAFSLNGLIYLTDNEENEVYHVTAYSLEPEDAMVLIGDEAFVFCRNKILLLGPSGRYLWKDTKWTSEFEALSREGRYDRLYAILEEQNDGKNSAIGIEDVAVVAYAQRNGELLYYDAENHCAYFGQEGKKGEITILRQSAPGARTEAAAFTPNCDSDNLPYTMINATVVAYIDEDKIIFQGVGEDWQTVHYTNKTHEGKTHPFVSFHVLHDEAGNEYFAYQDSKDMICLELLGSPVIEARFDESKYDAVYTVGSYIYGIVYDSDDLVSTITYANDLKDDESITDVWTENWSWDRIHMHSGLFGIQEEPEETIPWEDRPFEERYPIPELRTSVRQVGLYKDNVNTTSRFYSYRGPVKNFRFRYPSILYEKVDYTYSEDGSEVRLHFYCSNDPSSLTVTLRPNAEGIDHQTLLAQLQKQAEEEMSNEKVVRSGLADEEGTASTFYLTGYAADNTKLICTRLCWVNSEHIMEMELRMPKATDNQDQAYKDYYALAMYYTCGFGSGEEVPSWIKFRGKYGL